MAPGDTGGIGEGTTAALATSVSAAVRRNGRSNRCTIDCCLAPNVASISPRRPTIAAAVS